jgi:hypothetical protein
LLPEVSFLLPDSPITPSLTIQQLKPLQPFSCPQYPVSAHQTFESSLSFRWRLSLFPSSLLIPAGFLVGSSRAS